MIPDRPPKRAQLVFPPPKASKSYKPHLPRLLCLSSPPPIPAQVLGCLSWWAGFGGFPVSISKPDISAGGQRLGLHVHKSVHSWTASALHAHVGRHSRNITSILVLGTCACLGRVQLSRVRAAWWERLTQHHPWLVGSPRHS